MPDNPYQPPETPSGDPALEPRPPNDPFTVRPAFAIAGMLAFSANLVVFIAGWIAKQVPGQPVIVSLILAIGMLLMMIRSFRKTFARRADL